MLIVDKEIVNPLSILFPFVLGVYYYQFMLSDKQQKLELNTVYVLILFICSYVVGVFYILLDKKRILQKKVVSHQITSVLMIDVVLIFGLVIFFVECFLTGGFPFFIALLHKVNIYEDMYYLPILHYFVMLISIFPAIYYSFYKSGRISKLKLAMVCLLSVFVLINIMSRQIFILSIVFMFFTFAKVNKVNTNKYIFKVSVFSACAFILLGFVRIQSINNSVSQLDYLKAYAGVPSAREVNTFDVTYNLYTSQNLTTLNDMIDSIDRVGFGYGKYLTQNFLKTFKYDQAFNIEYLSDFDSFNRLGTIVADPYLDFGFTGVIIFGFLYGFLNSICFLKAKHSNSIRYNFFWAMLCYIMVMSVFTNFYNVLFSWLVFLFIYFITLKVKINR
ncbi:oligosaccharide repeat unit polymerase [Shewanella sp. 202IG2-18]|uniref:O-antigen polymerase n=1 Tax=Parashewanella hymeniacidonis TaxID=2807618 RepID=UPI0019617A04|nr:O-antigen polymerase [Parashewanella hymeniacidonis]MBM7072104.1 oligosaccharide repeat unit polymerase [Parashewanella hymeniacidonis]